ncbi:MAG: ABC-2 transporter permease [Acetatifactor sp.]
MAGLLYKDFVSIGGKKLTWLILCLTIAFIALRMAFPGYVENTVFMTMTEEGERVNVLDVFFVLGLGFFLVSVAGLMNGWTGKLVEGDDKNKIRGYIGALPLDKHAYIASKYIFIGIAAYVFLSVAFIWQLAASAFCGKGIFEELIGLVGGFIPTFIYMVLLLAAIELPLFIILGRDKAMLVKVAIIMLLAFGVIGFLFFGDLTWLESHFNVIIFMKWYDKHIFEVALWNVISPVIVLALYALSYRIACHFAGKETV